MILNFHFNARKIFLAKQLYCFMIILPEEMEGCISGSSANPHEFLGFHRLSDRKGSVIRVWEPSAERVEVVCEGGCTRLEMQCIDSRIDKLELRMVESFVPKTEFGQAMERVELHMLRIEEKLDKLVEKKCNT